MVQDEADDREDEAAGDDRTRGHQRADRTGTHRHREQHAEFADELGRATQHPGTAGQDGDDEAGDERQHRVGM